MVWIQPVLTSNGKLGDELFVSTGGGASSDAYKAFDSSATSYVNKMNSGAWLQFVTAKKIQITALTISSNTVSSSNSDHCLPSQGIFQVSYDEGATWQQAGTWTDTLGTGITADIVFDFFPEGNYFRLLSQGKSLVTSGNADLCNVKITADEIFVLDLDTSLKISSNVQLDFDTKREFIARWRYENFGTADLLSVEGGTVQLQFARYKTAFYQTARVKCFDIPATTEIWVKFDVYSENYSTRWRAYNSNNSSDVYGVCSESTGIAFWSPSKVHTDSSVLLTNKPQTVLLHMISDGSSGVIEAWLDGNKLYTYTGNVNNGEDFEAFYLQSDGARTTFSNVIISNIQIGLNENATMPLDFNVDLKCRHAVPFSTFVDTKRRTAITDSLLFSTYRQVAVKVVLLLDTSFGSCCEIKFNCDLIRKVPRKLIITPTENSIPTDDSETGGIQSINITIAEQQLTDQLSFVTINDFDIMEQVIGQYLDYKFNMRIESTSQQISYVNQNVTLTTCRCCNDVDQLLYTQTSYRLGSYTFEGGVYTFTKDGKVTMVYRPSARASSHVRRIAAFLKKQLVCQFNDFNSTVDMEQEGVTYQDLISEIFGWSSRIPHKLINVFIRDDKLYVIQRGYEENVIDISDAEIANLVIEKSLVRTEWGATKGTETGTTKVPAGYGWDPVLGNPISDDELSDDDDGEDEEATPRALLVKTVATDDGQKQTSVSHYSDGYSEETTTTSDDAEKGDTITTTTEYTYDADDNVIKTITTTLGGDVDTMVEVRNYYDSQKRLKFEVADKFEDEGDGWERIDSKVVHHYYSGNGQQNVTSVSGDGTVTTSTTAASRQTDLPTPYEDKQNVDSQNSNWERYFVNKNGHAFRSMPPGLRMYTYVNGQKIEVLGFTREGSSTETTTIDTLKLYDSSFPVDENKAISITSDLKWLNRKTQEVISFDIYNFNHVFDFNDKIIFNGNEYFLQSNQVTKDARIVNKQTLQLVRWY